VSVKAWQEHQDFQSEIKQVHRRGMSSRQEIFAHRRQLYCEHLRKRFDASTPSPPHLLYLVNVYPLH